jgi:prepilin-type processing-associated H-X9-DG protein
MPIPFTCPHCGHQTNVSDEYAGQSGPCFQCGKTIDVPTVAQPAVQPAAAPPVRGSKARASVVLAALALVLVGGAILTLLLMPAVQSAREAAKRTQCSNNLKYLALAMHNYYDTYGSFPPAYLADENGTPMHSWRVLILPFLEQQALYEHYNFDEPWDSPANSLVANTVLEVYRCPSETPINPTDTSYVMIVGPGTLYEGEEPAQFQDIRDGTSNTIMFVEAAGCGINWAEPRDLDIELLSLQINNPAGLDIRSLHPGGANTAFCDGSVRFLSETIDPATLECLITIADGVPVSAF